MVTSGCIITNGGEKCGDDRFGWDNYVCAHNTETEEVTCFHEYRKKCDPETYNGYADCTRCYDTGLINIRDSMLDNSPHTGAPKYAYVIQDECKNMYGTYGDTPLVGDWTGQGKDTLGVWRKGTFYLSSTLGGAPSTNDIVIPFGLATDTPVIWHHDGKDTIGVYRNGTFYLKKTNTPGGADLTFDYGTTGDFPVMGDWSGIGYDTVGIYRGGAFYLRNTNDSGNGDIEITGFGKPGDIPVIGDWSGTGKSKVGVYDPSTRIFSLKQDDGSTTTVSYPGKWTIDYNWDKIMNGECGTEWGDDGWMANGCMYGEVNVQETPIVGNFCGTGKDMVGSVYMPRSEWMIPKCPTSPFPILTSGETPVTTCNTDNCDPAQGKICVDGICVLNGSPDTTSSDSSVYLYGAVALVGLGALYLITQK